MHTHPTCMHVNILVKSHSSRALSLLLFHALCVSLLTGAFTSKIPLLACVIMNAIPCNMRVFVTRYWPARSFVCVYVFSCLCMRLLSLHCLLLRLLPCGCQCFFIFASVVFLLPMCARALSLSIFSLFLSSSVSTSY